MNDVQHTSLGRLITNTKAEGGAVYVSVWCVVYQ